MVFHLSSLVLDNSDDISQHHISAMGVLPVIPVASLRAQVHHVIENVPVKVVRRTSEVLTSSLHH